MSEAVRHDVLACEQDPCGCGCAWCFDACPDNTKKLCKHCEREIENRATPSMGSPSRTWWVHVDYGTRHCGGITGLSCTADPEENE